MMPQNPIRACSSKPSTARPGNIVLIALGLILAVALLAGLAAIGKRVSDRQQAEQNLVAAVEKAQRRALELAENSDEAGALNGVADQIDLMADAFDQTSEDFGPREAAGLKEMSAIMREYIVVPLRRYALALETALENPVFGVGPTITTSDLDEADGLIASFRAANEALRVSTDKLRTDARQRLLAVNAPSSFVDGFVDGLNGNDPERMLAIRRLDDDLADHWSDLVDLLRQTYGDWEVAEEDGSLLFNDLDDEVAYNAIQIQLQETADAQIKLSEANFDQIRQSVR